MAEDVQMDEAKALDYSRRVSRAKERINDIGESLSELLRIHEDMLRDIKASKLGGKNGIQGHREAEGGAVVKP